jgi:chromosome segregation ATPase
MIAKVPLTAGQTTSAIERPIPISSKTDNIEIPGHATLHLEQLPVKHSAHLQHDGVVMGTLVSPTVNLAPIVQVAAPVRRSAKLSNMPIGRGLSEANKAEDDSKQEAFTEEIARLSALAEDRRCELLDTHARIVSLEEELGAQKKHAQKATAGMYVEMDRMQTLIDSDQVEMNDMLAKLKEQGKQSKELEEASNQERKALSLKMTEQEKKIASLEEAKAALHDKLHALQADNADIWAKIEGNAESSRLMDENRHHEIGRLQRELEQAHADRVLIKSALSESDVNSNTKQGELDELTRAVDVLQVRLQETNNDLAISVAEVWDLRAKGTNPTNNDEELNSALLSDLSSKLQEVTKQRDDRQNALEDVSKHMSEAKRQQAAAEIRLSEVQETSRIEHQRVRQEMLARISDIRT